MNLSELFDQPVIVGMVADPEPDDGILFTNAESSVGKTAADGEDGFRVMHALVVETRVEGIVTPELVILGDQLLNFCGQAAVVFPEGRQGHRFHAEVSCGRGLEPS